MATHEQVWVTVNAPVDKGVSGIISALSEFAGLETVESCESDIERRSWVCFRYGPYWKHPWRALADFVLGYMAPGLVAAVGDDANVRIQVTASGQIFGELSVRPGATHRVEMALHQLARDHPSRRRSSGYCDGTSGT